MLIWESGRQSGGLLLLWRMNLKVTSSTVRSNHLDIHIEENCDAGWRFTGLYGDPSSGRKQYTWDYIRDLKGMANLPSILFTKL